MSGLFYKDKPARVILLSVDEIDPNPAQPRVNFDEDALRSLSESIRQNGVLQPITVRKNFKGHFELIAGERRLRAARLAGLKRIPSIVMETAEHDSAILALMENLQREDLNYFEQASALASALIEWNVTQEEAAERLCMAQSTVANKIRLTRIPKSQQEVILKSGLTERHARALLRITDDEKRADVIDTIVKKGYNVSRSESYIEEILDGKTAKRRSIPVIKDVRIFVNTINKALAVMKSAGIPAESEKTENEMFIEYVVRIPKQVS